MKRAWVSKLRQRNKRHSRPRRRFGILETLEERIPLASDFIVNLAGGGAAVLDVAGGNLEVTRGATTLFSEPVTNVNKLTINGDATIADTLSVDFSGGDPLPAGGVVFDGGPGANDSLVLGAASTTSVAHTFTGGSSGDVTLGGSIDGVLTYSNLEPITDNVSATDRSFTFNGGSESIAFNGVSPGVSSIDSTIGESVQFANPSGSLTIDAGSGTDTLNVTGAVDVGTSSLSITAEEINVLNSLTAGGAIDLHTNGDDTTLTISAAVSAGASSTVTTDSLLMNTSTGRINVGGNTLTIVPDAGDADFINLGSTTHGAIDTLQISEAELDQITAGTLDIGDATSTSFIRVSDAITRSAATNLNLRTIATSTSNSIDFNGGSLDAGGGNVDLSTFRVLTDSVSPHVTASALTVVGSTLLGDALDPLRFNADTLSVQPQPGQSFGNAYLQEADSVTIVAPGLNVGTGVGVNPLRLVGGTFVAGAADVINDSTALEIRLAATLKLNGNSETIGGLGGSDTRGRIINGSATPGTLTVNQGSNARFDGPIGGGGANDNNLNLIKTGLGRLTLSGTNTYTGTTTVNQGRLEVNGSLADGAAATDVTVNGGSLGGRGAIAGSVQVASGAISPGTTVPDTMETGAVTFASGTTFEVDIASASSHDQLSITGGVDLGGATLDASGTFSSSPGQPIVIIENVGAGDTVTGTFNGLNEGDTVTINGLDFTLSYAGGVNSNDVVLTPPPETTVEVVSGNLVITDVNGGTTNDSLTIQRSGSSVRVSDSVNSLTAGAGANQINSRTVEVPLSSINSGNIQVNTLGGNDEVKLSMGFGDFIPDGGVVFAGGNSTSDQITILGSGLGMVTYDYTGSAAGSITIGTIGTVTYSDVESISSPGIATNAVFNLPGNGDAGKLSDDNSIANSRSRLLSTAATPTFPRTDFATPSTSVTINLGADDAVFEVAGVDFSFGTALTIDGQLGTDTLNVTSLLDTDSDRNLVLTAEQGNLNANVDVGSGIVTLNGGRYDVASGATVTAGTVSVQSGATLGGHGNVAAAVNVASGGTVSPGSSSGCLAANSVSFAAGSTFDVDGTGATACSGFDKLTTSSVSLGGATLSAAGTPGDNQQLTVIDNTGGGSSTAGGLFQDPAGNSLTEGSSFVTGRTMYTVSYVGGTGNDVVLTTELLRLVNDQTFSVAENSSNGTTVGTVAVTQYAGASQTFEITGGNGAGGFDIDSSSGEITVANQSVLDFETTPQFSLTVKVTDPLGDTDSATMTIDLTDVQATIAIADNSLTEGDSGSATLGLPVTLTGTVGPFTVSYSTADGNATSSSGDYVAVSGGSITFAGTSGESKNANVTINGDLMVEPNETFTVNLTGVSGTNDVTIQGSSGTATILNNDVADFGDAPDSYGTSFASGGPFHNPSSLRLGASRDGEADGTPSGDALGDDQAGSDDEDGVTFTSALRPGGTATVTVNASAGAKLDAYFDFNIDGDFDDAGEKIFNSHAVSAGSNNLSFSIPPTAATGATYVRFRLTSAGGSGWGGGAADGEVEDYRVVNGAFVDLPNAIVPGYNFVDAYNITPGGMAGFASATIPGSTFFPHLGITLDMANPMITMYNTADATGHTIGFIYVPPGMSGQPIYVQVFEVFPVKQVSPLASYQVPLKAADGEGTGAAAITDDQLAIVVDSAIDRWEDAGLSPAQINLMKATAVELADLPAGRLGELSGDHIMIDVNAAGHGWFVDPTPADDAEFADIDGELQGVSIESAAGIDLLTAVMHELGHVIGVHHDHDEGLMSETLSAGVRLLPSVETHEKHEELTSVFVLDHSEDEVKRSDRSVAQSRGPTASRTNDDRPRTTVVRSDRAYYVRDEESNSSGDDAVDALLSDDRFIESLSIAADWEL